MDPETCVLPLCCFVAMLRCDFLLGRFVSLLFCISLQGCVASMFLCDSLPCGFLAALFCCRLDALSPCCLDVDELRCCSFALHLPLCDNDKSSISHTSEKRRRTLYSCTSNYLALVACRRDAIVVYAILVFGCCWLLEHIKISCFTISRPDRVIGTPQDLKISWLDNMGTEQACLEKMKASSRIA